MSESNSLMGARDRLPVLIIVSGAPATGKSTLATHLSARLGLILLSRDEIKEAIMDVIPAHDVEQSRLAGSASFEVMYRVLGRVLSSSDGAVLDSTFRRGFSEESLRPFVSACAAVQVHCIADLPAMMGRFAARIESGSRHPGHHFASRNEEISVQVARGDYDPLDLEIPLIRIDSSAPGEIDFASVVRRVGTVLDDCNGDEHGSE